MFSWKKLGHIFDPTQSHSNSWMKSFAQSPSAVIFDDFVRIFIASRGLPDSNGQFRSQIGFVDLDRTDLKNVLRVGERPVLALGDLGCFDEFGTNPVSVVRNNNELWMFYAGWTRCETVPFNAAIGLAISTNSGATFQRLGPGPVLSYSPDEPFVIGSPRVKRFNNRWFLHYAAGKVWNATSGKPEPVYKIRAAVSVDGVHWEKLHRDLIENRLDENECQAGAEIVELDGRFHMFFSYRHNVGFKSREKGYRIGYAVSDDLINWTRNDVLAGIDVSENPQDWDSEMVSYANIFKLDGSVYMLYQGNGIGQNGFGLAVLDAQNSPKGTAS